MNLYLDNIQLMLDEYLDGCREDMHEPDEQGIRAVITGTHLDNAMGANPYENNLEFSVGIYKPKINVDGSSDEDELRWFNLADLIALARMATGKSWASDDIPDMCDEHTVNVIEYLMDYHKDNLIDRLCGQCEERCVKICNGEWERANKCNYDEIRACAGEALNDFKNAEADLRYARDNLDTVLD